MKKLINKIGLDKIAHFGVGGLICAFITFVIMLQEGLNVSLNNIVIPTIGSIIVFFISWIKEQFIDNEFNWYDIIAAMLGCIIIYIGIIIGVLFNILSK